MSLKKLAGYFDYAAATPMDPEVLDAMQPYFSESFFNPSAIYQPAREVKQVLKMAREVCAKSIGAKPVEIIFTAGGTEANNLAIDGLMNVYPDANVVISAIEHPSVLEPAVAHYHKICAVDAKGVINILQLEQLIDDNTVLVSVILANNEIGTIQPIKKVTEVVERVRKLRQKSGNKLPIYVHTDASQATNYLDLQVGRLGVDLMTVNGGKIYGPKQSGLLYVKTGVILNPIVKGGGQERKLRSGTENVVNIVGFATALFNAQKNSKQNAIKTKKLLGNFINQINTLTPEAEINGSLKHRLPNNLNVTFKGQDNERLIMLLDDAGFYAASGSACSASDKEPSHVLKALGLTHEQIQSSLRFSIGKFTTEGSINKLVNQLKKIIE